MLDFQQLLSLSDDLMCVVDESAQVIDTNSNWKKMIRDDLTHRISLIHLVEEEQHRERLLSFLKNPDLHVMRISSCRIIDPNGNLRWFDLRIKKIPAQRRALCLMKEITETKELSYSLEQIAQSCHVGTWEFHSINERFRCSPKCGDILSLKFDIRNITFSEFRSLFSESDMKLLDEVRTNQFDFIFKTKINEQEKWIRLFGKKEYLLDGHYCIHGILQDLTKEKMREMTQFEINIELSSYEKGLDQFSIVARTDAKGRIIYANEEFCRISKYSEDELLGQDHRILNSGHHPKMFFEEMWKCIKSGKSWRGEIKNRAKDGSLYWVDTIIIPVRNSDQELQEILSFRYEITQFKKLQEENQLLKEQLNKSVQEPVLA